MTYEAPLRIPAVVQSVSFPWERVAGANKVGGQGSERRHATMTVVGDEGVISQEILDVQTQRAADEFRKIKVSHHHHCQPSVFHRLTKASLLLDPTVLSPASLFVSRPSSCTISVACLVLGE